MTDLIGRSARVVAAPGTARRRRPADDGSRVDREPLRGGAGRPGHPRAGRARARPRGSTRTWSPASGTRASTPRASSPRGPVVGIAEAAMHAATLVGRRFAVVTTLGRTTAPGARAGGPVRVPRTRASRCARARSPSWRSRTRRPRDRLVDECRRAVERGRGRRGRPRLRGHGRAVRGDRRRDRRARGRRRRRRHGARPVAGRPRAPAVGDRRVRPAAAPSRWPGCSRVSRSARTRPWPRPWP